VQTLVTGVGQVDFLMSVVFCGPIKEFIFGSAAFNEVSLYQTISCRLAGTSWLDYK